MGGVCARLGVQLCSVRRGGESRSSCLARKLKKIWRRSKEYLVGSTGGGFAIVGRSGGVIELDAAGLVGARGETAQGGGGCLVSMLQILVFLWHQVVCAVIFITGLTEEEHLLVVFPFGHIEFVRHPARLDRLVFTVENCSKVLELAFDVFNCKNSNERVTFLMNHNSYFVSQIKTSFVPSVRC